MENATYGTVLFTSSLRRPACGHLLLHCQPLQQYFPEIIVSAIANYVQKHRPGASRINRGLVCHSQHL